MGYVLVFHAQALQQVMPPMNAGSSAGLAAANSPDPTIGTQDIVFGEVDR